MNYIEMGKLKGQSDELTEITIIKEYLLSTHDELSSEINREVEHAQKKHIPEYLINIFKTKLEERKNFINHLMKIYVDKYWELENKTKDKG
jgi:hypothetical protein